MARWDDKHELLSRNIEPMKDKDKAHRDNLLRGIMLIIRKHAPNLPDEFVQESPLDIYMRRWYDKAPYL